MRYLCIILGILGTVWLGRLTALFYLGMQFSWMLGTEHYHQGQDEYAFLRFAVLMTCCAAFYTFLAIFRFPGPRLRTGLACLLLILVTTVFPNFSTYFFMVQIIQLGACLLIGLLITTLWFEAAERAKYRRGKWLLLLLPVIPAWGCWSVLIFFGQRPTFEYPLWLMERGLIIFVPLFLLLTALSALTIWFVLATVPWRQR